MSHRLDFFAGVTEFEMLWARAALDSLMNALATAIVLFFVFVVFQFHNGGSFLPVVCLLYLMGLLGLWIGELRNGRAEATCAYNKDASISDPPTKTCLLSFDTTESSLLAGPM